MFENYHNFAQLIGKGLMTFSLWLGASSPQPILTALPIDRDEVHQIVQDEIVSQSKRILGASVQTSEVRALFTTTLASKITSSATSLILSSAIDFDGNTLASSTYGFIIDEGLSNEEMVLADCTATVCTNITRGLSGRTGTTSVSALRLEHGRGAEVKITDAPSLIFATNVLRGVQNIENILHYNTAPTFIRNTDIVDKKYVDDTAFSGAGVIDATANAKGVVELATQIETASSTSNGSSGILVIPATNATSTYNAATAPLRVVVTNNQGMIDPGFVASSTVLSVARNFYVSATSTLATTTINGLIPYGLIASTFATTGASSMYLDIPNRTNLRISIMASSSAAAKALITFNSDSSAIYDTIMATSSGYSISQTSIAPSPGFTANPAIEFINMDVLSNSTTSNKIGYITDVLIAQNPATQYAYSSFNGNFVYRSLNPITRITVTESGLSFGAFIKVYGDTSAL